jgi:hypothetical protein
MSGKTGPSGEHIGNYCVGFVLLQQEQQIEPCESNTNALTAYLITYTR